MREGQKASSWYRNYVLLIVGLVSVFDYYDRNLLTILVEPIERDLHLSNGQMGLLMGFGFALMYSILGVPMARIADRFGRSQVIACVIAVWSGMTAASGFAGNFVTLLLARVGVGVGEAGAFPAMQALVTEYFPPRRRGVVLSVIGACGAVGLSLALALGGLVADRWGWRAAFFVASAPGIALAILVFLTVRDPPRPAGATDAGVPQIPGFGEAIRTLWKRKSFVLLCLGVTLAAITAYGWAAWTPAFLMLTYGLSAGEVGIKYSAAIGPVSIIAIFTGGLIYDRLMKLDPRWALWIIALSFGVAIPLSVATYLIHDFTTVLVLAVFGTFISSLWIGPAYATVQNLAGPKLRALSAAIFMMIINIVGLGFGPVVPGILSDALKPRFGERSLAISLCLLAAFMIASLLPLLIAARSYHADVREANR